MRAARRELPGHRIDTQKLLRHLNKAIIPNRLPKCAIRSTQPGVWVILDHRPKSAQFHHDINRVQALLEESLGSSGGNYRLISVVQDTNAGYDILSSKYPRVRFDQCLRGTFIILIAPALGIDASEWKPVTGLIAIRNARLRWLNPAQPNASDPAGKLLKFDERAAYRPLYSSGSVDPIDFLLACISQSWKVCPGLLRALRHLLPLDRAPVSLEMEILQSPKVLTDETGIRLRPSFVSEYRQAFLELPEPTRTAAIALVEDWHKNWPPELRLWEKAVWESQGLGHYGAQRRWASIAEFTRQPGARGAVPTLSGWLVGAGQRQPSEFWRTPVGAEMGRAVRIAADKLARSKLPRGLEPSQQKSKAQDFVSLYPGSSGIKVNPFAPQQAEHLFRFSSAPVYRNVNGRLHKLENDDVVQGQKNLQIQSGTESVEICQLEKPDWADAIEQGPEGLFCTVDKRRLRWCYPGEPFYGKLHPLAAPTGTEKAAWVDEAQWQLCQTDSAPYLPEGSRIDRDQYGYYADLSVKRVRFRMRWIPPGAFWMGSPEDEQERIDDEIRHRVVISQGFWLGETACTQELWKTMMWKNPSFFKGDRLPIENVSWNDSHRFCEKLGKKSDALAFRLPSEAEWEYACRAGTETVFWWGNELNTGQANYDGSYPYAGGEKGNSKDKTIDVKSFEPNPWGLYQMHGNIYEWCQDWYGEYTAASESLDPSGADRGTDRVIRGGSWSSSGMWLRAAIRSGYAPDLRYDNLGFLLAAGPRQGGSPNG